MQEKKANTFKTPDITKMQEVVINAKTKLYIPVGADPEQARLRYNTRQEAKGRALISVKKPALT